MRRLNRARKNASIPLPIRPSNGKMMGEVIGPLRVPIYEGQFRGDARWSRSQPIGDRIGAATADGSPLSIDPGIEIVIVY